MLITQTYVHAYSAIFGFGVTQNVQFYQNFNFENLTPKPIKQRYELCMYVHYLEVFSYHDEKFSLNTVVSCGSMSAFKRQFHEMSNKCPLHKDTSYTSTIAVRNYFHVVKRNHLSCCKLYYKMCV